MDKFIPIKTVSLKHSRQVVVDGDQNETGNTSSPTPVIATRQTTMSNDDPNKKSYVVHDPSLRIGPTQRGRGRPKGSKNSATTTKRGRGRPKDSKNSATTTTKKAKIYDPNSRKVTYSLNFDSGITEEQRDIGNQEIHDSVLMRFEAVRRRLCQLGVKQHLLTTAISNCKNLGVMTNMKIRIGPVPGVKVGDIYFYWREMNLVGLHKQIVKGIDYFTNEDGATVGPLATSVVTSKQYPTEIEGFETLIYTGQGRKKDQVLNMGNLALQRSIIQGNDVRVIIGQKDPNDKNQNIYIYDGLYSVSGFKKEKGELGFDEFKFTLAKRTGQPSGYATWKKIQEWRKCGFNNSINGFIHVDLSFGKEDIPISAVNEVDESDKKMPENFTYVTSQNYSSLPLIFTDPQSFGCQNCRGYSCHKNMECNYLTRNDGKLPYVNNILVCRTSMVYECGESCSCFPDCKSIVVQRGLKFHLQVFKTEKCGWGLRSWDPIRAGSFICEFVGLSKKKEDVEEADNEYLFDTSRFYSPFRWNYEPELVDEDFREQVAETFNLPTQILISAKDYGNVSRFMNHSCSPNVLWQPIMVGTEAGSYLRIGFFARKNIPPLTELRYDYGMSSVVRKVGEDGRKLFEGKKICLCDSVKCRGSFG